MVCEECFSLSGGVGPLDVPLDVLLAVRLDVLAADHTRASPIYSAALRPSLCAATDNLWCFPPKYLRRTLRELLALHL